MSQTELFDPMDCDPAKLLDRMAHDLDPETAKRAWPKGLADMVDVVCTALTRKGHSEEDAQAIAQLAIAALADYQGGRVFYLPRDDKLRQALRANMIYRDIGRYSAGQLGERHNLTPQQIYNIVAEQRALHVGRVQGRLFGEGEVENHVRH